VVLTGAGFSAESGVPTFRGPGGLWEGSRPEDLATLEAFARDPERVWRWYAWRRDLVDGAVPHAGHGALVVWETRAPALRIVTQNVDRLHQKAGSRSVVELHGNLVEALCTSDGRIVADWREAAQRPPRCPCGALLRPRVVWFGEVLPTGVMEEAAACILDADLLVVAGTSAVVAPASLLPGLARLHGIPILEVNPAETPLSSIATVRVASAAGTAFARLLGQRDGTSESRRGSPEERPSRP